MPSSANVALRKRQEIAKANRMMFLWVTGASAIVGIAAVLGITLYNKLTFNQTVIAEQAKTVSTLEANQEAAKQLIENARVLDTNQNLRDARVDQNDDNALQVILEALPSSENKAALGSSLQDKLLKLDGITIDSLSVGDAGEAGASAGSVAIKFNFVAKATDRNKLFDLLKRLESSIRPVKILTLSLEEGQTDTTLTVSAESYYQPQVSIDLGEKTLPERKGR